ncbi:MAG TPA: hypothetical protein VKW76_05800 [Candidatus Binatia bacterium]|nr:hypothetical protein [Candidatus Binatia bacterium]
MDDPVARARPSVQRGGLVLPFRRRRRRAADAERNADWDRLLELTRAAWSWRDPESLDLVERLVERLHAQVRREWSA